MSKRVLLSALFFLTVAPTLAHACACGCGVFDVGTASMMPVDAGVSVWLEHDYMDQNRNWSGAKSSAPSNNADREIVSQFITAGAQYMFNRAWGAEIDIPYTVRTFNSADDSGSPTSAHHSALGDIHVKGIYAGFSDDMSTGLTYGLKLPTGDRSFTRFDRDTSIGTGSTDLLLGGYHMGALTQDAKLNWFIDGQWDHALTAVDHYRPGDEWDTALGTYYKLGSILGNDNISPLLQWLGSYRLHDNGINADPSNSGYLRLLISPGVEYDVGQIKLYGDIEVPVYQNVNGNQLTAPVLTKFTVAYNF